MLYCHPLADVLCIVVHSSRLGWRSGGEGVGGRKRGGGWGEISVIYVIRSKFCLYPTTKNHIMQLSKRYSPETSSNDLVLNPAFC